MAWDKVGSARLSKSGNAVVLVVSKIRYIINIDDINNVLARKQDYAVIFKPPEDEPKTDELKSPRSG